tara:strand:+ start:130 stop:837 length:708 start_codon:yes stop_codon:yes gene_type:complete
MNKCYGYVRVSTQYQVDDGFSLEFQEKEIRNYAEYKKLNLVKIFYDRGKSGREIKTRKELQEVLNIMEKDDVLIFYSLSRLVRKAKDFHNIDEELRDRGCSIVSIKENLETVTTMGKAFAGITAVFAELESNSTSDRVKEGMKMKKEKGERLGRIPYGWKLSNGKGTDLIEVPEEQVVINLIKKMREEGNTAVKIIKHLEDNGIPPPKLSKQWRPCTVLNMVKKEVNIKGRQIKE